MRSTWRWSPCCMATKHVLPPPERRAFGQSRRKQVPRQAQNRWRAADRQTDPIDALAVSAVGRVPALLAIKWQRMAASPFGFFRGAVPVMAADLAVLPHTGIFTQLCGDAHVRNLGAYAAPDGRLVFDVNDFDETMPGPWEWDVKRLAPRLVLASQQSGQAESRQDEAVRTFVRSYRTHLAEFARMPVARLARHLITRGPNERLLDKIIENARRITPARNLRRLVVERKG